MDGSQNNAAGMQFEVTMKFLMCSAASRKKSDML